MSTETKPVIEVREVVREKYAERARAVSSEGASCCAPGCCSNAEIDPVTSNLYSAAEAAEIPADALAASLGCGNPTALAELHAGETVLDLGSGGGIDVLLSARRVGPTGFAYGLDMTDEMLELANRNKAAAGAENVEFLKGTIEEIPLPDDRVDVIISNCVINLSPDKEKVIADAFRALKPGGRLAISDIVALQPLPVEIRNDLALYSGCMAGASLVSDLENALKRAGFTGIKIEEKTGSRQFIRDWAPDRGIENFVASATIEATKPIS